MLCSELGYLSDLIRHLYHYCVEWIPEAAPVASSYTSVSSSRLTCSYSRVLELRTDIHNVLPFRISDLISSVTLMIGNFNLVAEFPKCDGILYNLPPIPPKDMPLFLWFRDTVLSICMCRKVAIVFGVVALYAKFLRPC